MYKIKTFYRFKLNKRLLFYCLIFLILLAYIIIVDLYIQYGIHFVLTNRTNIGTISETFNSHKWYVFEVMVYPICNFLNSDLNQNFCSQSCLICEMKKIWNNTDWITLEENLQQITSFKPLILIYIISICIVIYTIYNNHMLTYHWGYIANKKIIGIFRYIKIIIFNYYSYIIKIIIDILALIPVQSVWILVNAIVILSKFLLHNSVIIKSLCTFIYNNSPDVLVNNIWVIGCYTAIYFNPFSNQGGSMSCVANTIIIPLGVIKLALLIDAVIIIVNYSFKSKLGQYLISRYPIKYINKEKSNLLYKIILSLIILIKSNWILYCIYWNKSIFLSLALFDISTVLFVNIANIFIIYYIRKKKYLDK